MIIDDIYPRKNYITRQSPHNKNIQHIIASNLDQSLLMATLRSPKTSTGFIDRFLAASEAFHVPAILVFNKSDVYKEKDLIKFEEIKKVYQPLGPEMRNLINDCQFNNCMHISEPGCAVKKAVEEGRIYPERFFSYLNILDSMENKYS